MRYALAIRHSHKGFTLLELSVVLVIISLVTAMAVTSGLAVISTARQSATLARMALIDSALMQYRTANDRLPCPADITLAPTSADYGIEAGADASSTIAVGTGLCTGALMLPVANFTATGITNTNKTSAEGAVPFVTLGIPADAMLDGWGNRFRYAVDVSMTALSAFVSTPLGCNTGPITVYDGINYSTNPRSTSAIYALISHGSNGHGAYPRNGGTTPVNTGSSSADQLTNCHCTSTGATNTTSGVQLTGPATYVQKAAAYDSGQTGNAAYYFDDIVTYKERWQMQTPWDKAGPCVYLYITDTGNSRVQVFDLNGNYIRSVGSGAGSGTGQFTFNTVNGNGLTVDGFGNLWVGDSGSNSRVQEFDPTGTYIKTLTNLVGQPFWLAADASNNIWVQTNYTGNAQLAEYSNSGTAMTTFGSTGTAAGQFSIYGAMFVFDRAGNIWVGDSGNNRVQKCTTSGICTVYGSYGFNQGQLYNPNNLTFDPYGNLWVMNSYGDPYRLEEFNNTFTYKAQYDIYGNTGCNVQNPGRVASDPNGNIWAVDINQNRVFVMSNSGTCLGQINCSGTGLTSTSTSCSGTGPGQFSSPIDLYISNAGIVR